MAERLQLLLVLLLLMRQTEEKTRHHAIYKERISEKINERNEETEESRENGSFGWRRRRSLSGEALHVLS